MMLMLMQLCSPSLAIDRAGCIVFADDIGHVGGVLAGTVVSSRWDWKSLLWFSPDSAVIVSTLISCCLKPSLRSTSFRARFRLTRTGQQAGTQTNPASPKMSRHRRPLKRSRRTTRWALHTLSKSPNSCVLPSHRWRSYPEIALDPSRSVSVYVRASRRVIKRASSRPSTRASSPLSFCSFARSSIQALIASRELIEMESAEVERDLADLDVSHIQLEPLAAMNPLPWFGAHSLFEI